MSDSTQDPFVPGPIELDNVKETPVKRTPARKAKESGLSARPRGRPKKKEAVSIEQQAETPAAVSAPKEEPLERASTPALPKKEAAKEESSKQEQSAQSGPQEEYPHPFRDSPQRELLFSSDAEDDDTDDDDRDDDRSDSREERDDREPSREVSTQTGVERNGEAPASEEDASRREDSKQGERHPRRDGYEGRDFQRKGGGPQHPGQGGFKQHKPFGGGKGPNKPHQQANNPGQKNHQPQGNAPLSNRQKKQLEWKAKQQQQGKKSFGGKDRFKIDGLNTDFDNSLDLGSLPEWEVLNNQASLDAYLAGLESPESPSQEEAGTLDFNEVYGLPLDQLRERLIAAGLELPASPNRKMLIERLLADAHRKRTVIILKGSLEILSDGNGMLSYSSDSYRLRALSAFVPAFFVKRWGLLRGHEVTAKVIPAVEGATCPLVIDVIEVQGMLPEKLSEVIPFTEQIPYYPLNRIFLESLKQEDANKVSMRVVDLISPIGFGQRGLIVAPPRTGKTVIMQGIANSVQYNYPDAHLIVLLIDERPEEVTDFRRRIKGGEVISSTFDENAESHVHAAEMVIERARRMVETGKHVVILLDSITRLARAYNTVMPNSGKILSGGVEANALQKPKRFFGSARNIEGGGSLTIIATALVETGSKMDEVIFEEFKGTGNMELHLDRALVDKRVFPSLSMEKSGTRKEELLYHPDELNKIYALRRAMKGIPSTDAMEMLIGKVKKTGSNAEFLMTVGR
jgi:transcription termination factor Rho